MHSISHLDFCAHASEPSVRSEDETARGVSRDEGPTVAWTMDAEPRTAAAHGRHRPTVARSTGLNGSRPRSHAAYGRFVHGRLAHSRSAQHPLPFGQSVMQGTGRAQVGHCTWCGARQALVCGSVLQINDESG